MPNWCYNRLTIKGDEKEVERFVKQAQGSNQHYEGQDKVEESEFSFHQLVPIPENVVGGSYEPYGYASETVLWGVKWGAINSQTLGRSDGSVSYYFETPYGTPTPFLIRVSSKFPELSFTLSYEEELNGWAGEQRYEDGELFILDKGAERKETKANRDFRKKTLMNVFGRLGHGYISKMENPQVAEEFVLGLDPSLSLAI